jgi:ATP-binding cassette, subfamily C, bacterial LapB
MKEFWQRFSANKRLAWELGLASFLISVLGLTSAVYSIQVLNRYLTLGIDATLITITIGSLIALSLELVLRSVRHSIAQWVCSRSDEALSEAAFATASRSLYVAYDLIPVAQRREALAGVSSIQQTFSATNLASVLDSPFALLYLLVLGFLSPTILILVLIFMLLVAIVTLSVFAAAAKPSEDLAKVAANQGARQAVLSTHPELVRAFRTHQHLGKDWQAGYREQSLLRHAVATVQNFSNNAGYAFTVLMGFLVMGVGAREVFAGQLDVGSLIGVNILAVRALSSLTRLLQLAEPVARAKRAQEALGQLARLPMERQEGMSLPGWSGQIGFEDFAFSYPRQPTPLIESLVFSINGGGVVAVTGANGSGKTTFSRLLAGLLEPSRGRITLDGMDLRQLLPDWWRSQLIYLPQEPAFFDGSLRDNLSILNPEITEDELLALCRELGLGNYLDTTPDGLLMPIRNSGGQIPVGIRRRLALARALAGNGRLVILDDPTEGVDATGCQAIASVLNRLVREQKTIFVMTNEAFIISAAQAVIDLNQKPCPRIVHAPVKGEALP